MGRKRLECLSTDARQINDASVILTVLVRDQCGVEFAVDAVSPPEWLAETPTPARRSVIKPLT